MRDIFTTELFRKDLDNLDKAIRERVGKTIRQIKQDPYYPGLQTHPQKTIPNRKIMRSRVNDNFRILWEQLDGGNIGLWRVAKHDVIDAIRSVPKTASLDQKFVYRDEETQTAVEVPLNQPQPFKSIPDNVLRLFGVPDDYLPEVQGLSIPDLNEAEDLIWELEIPEYAKDILRDILLLGEDWNVENFFDPKQLLYRATVDQLESYCKGEIGNLLLKLTPEQLNYVQMDATGPILIKGVAGSGKTTIGLYRTHHLADKRRMFGKDTAILLLTYTKTLTAALQQLHTELSLHKGPYTITISAYKEWMLQHLNSSGKHYSEAEKDCRSNFAKKAQREIARKYTDDKVVCRLYPGKLLDEFDKVIRARGLKSLEEYQAIERVGCGRGLNRERHRPIVWEIYEHYQQQLDDACLFDWADLSRLVLEHCRPLPQYDVVIIDEAQDLPPSDLHLATKLIPDYTESRSLTLLADPAQSIYYRGIPWKEAGINISGGRTRILAKNFRNTKQVMESARPVLDGCQDLKDQGEYIPPASTDRKGPKPLLVQYKNTADAWNYILKETIMLCRPGKYRPGDIAIIARTNKPLKNLQKRFKDENIPYNFFRDGFDILENQVKLITMHSAKGLEFPIVFIIDLDDDVMPHIHYYSETKYEDELQERKLFYVSMTRAAERLYLLYPKHNRCRFLRDLDDSTVNAVSDWREKPFKRKRKAK